MSNYPPPPPPGEPNPYGQPNPYGGQPGGTVDHPKGTTILILGIVSLVCCGLFTGIPAIIMGRSALAEIDAQPYHYGNRGSVKAGYICGIIGTALSAIGILLNIILLAVGASLY
jgi:hypothetical protein